MRWHKILEWDDKIYQNVWKGENRKKINRQDNQEQTAVHWEWQCWWKSSKPDHLTTITRHEYMSLEIKWDKPTNYEGIKENKKDTSNFSANIFGNLMKWQHPEKKITMITKILTQAGKHWDLENWMTIKETDQWINNGKP